ncbi:MAG: hypothetical protein IMF19_14395 [Proteobacteria bacterium]|nr:hypothetical protein [Pseudomonadota bacterium]
MGRYNPEKDGEEAAEDIAEGEITKEELIEKYKDAKFRGQGEAFKKGYAKGAEKTFNE